PAPANVVRKVELTIPPGPTVKLLASHPRLAAAPSVITPLQKLSPARLRSAPLAETPVPLNVKDSLLTEIPPCNCSAAPLAITVPAFVLPSAEAFWTLRTPVVTVVTPE